MGWGPGFQAAAGGGQSRAPLLLPELPSGLLPAAQCLFLVPRAQEPVCGSHSPAGSGGLWLDEAPCLKPILTLDKPIEETVSWEGGDLPSVFLSLSLVCFLKKPLYLLDLPSQAVP